jgi:ABC-2 type transport system permease protein
MRKFWALLKVMLINYLGLSAMQIKDPENRTKYLKKLGLGAIIVVALAPTIVLYTDLLIKGFDLLAPIQQQGAILTLGIVVVSTIIFFFGIFYVMSFFYFATDTQNLLALPLSGWQVLGARFGVVLVYEYLTELPFLLPPFWSTA